MIAGPLQGATPREQGASESMRPSFTLQSGYWDPIGMHEFLGCGYF